MGNTELDEFGEVITSDVQWSDYIPCNIKVNRDQRMKAFVGGVYRDVSLQILVEAAEFTHTKIRVYDRQNALMGEFVVLSTIALDTFNRTQILV